MVDKTCYATGALPTPMSIKNMYLIIYMQGPLIDVLPSPAQASLGLGELKLFFRCQDTFYFTVKSWYKASISHENQVVRNQLMFVIISVKLSCYLSLPSPLKHPVPSDTISNKEVHTSPSKQITIHSIQ